MSSQRLRRACGSRPVVHECRRDRKPLALPARELRLRLPRPFLQLDLTQERELVDLEVVAGGEEPHGLARRQIVRERACLELHADPALDARGVREYVDAGHGRGPSVGFSKSLEYFDRRGLPRPVRTEQAEDFSPLDGEADAADGFDISVALPQVGDLHDRRHQSNATGSRRTWRTRGREDRRRTGGAPLPRRRCAPRSGSGDEVACT